MKKLIQAAVATLFAASAAQAQQAVQWRVEDGGNGHWYAVDLQFRLWADAKAHAESIGGTLAATTSGAELAAIRPLIDSTLGADYWLGASRTTSSSPWRWVTGEPFDATFWEPGAPDNGPESNCLEVIGRPESPGFGLWNDETFFAWGGGNYSIIEWSADCNSDGIVDYGQILQGQLADTNADGVPDICQVPTCADADLFRDFTVNGADLGILLSQWGPNTPLTVSDLNGDGGVDGADLGLFLSFWGACP